MFTNLCSSMPTFMFISGNLSVMNIYLSDMKERFKWYLNVSVYELVPSIVTLLRFSFVVCVRFTPLSLKKCTKKTFLVGLYLSDFQNLPFIQLRKIQVYLDMISALMSTITSRNLLIRNKEIWKTVFNSHPKPMGKQTHLQWKSLWSLASISKSPAALQK